MASLDPLLCRPRAAIVSLKMTISEFDTFSVLILKSPSIIRFEYCGILSVRRAIISSGNMPVIVLFVELGADCIYPLNVLSCTKLLLSILHTLLLV